MTHKWKTIKTEGKFNYIICEHCKAKSIAIDIPHEYEIGFQMLDESWIEDDIENHHYIFCYGRRN